MIAVVRHNDAVAPRTEGRVRPVRRVDAAAARAWSKATQVSEEICRTI